MTFKVLAAAKAAALDKELMSTCGYSIDQLMELAGLSVAQSVFKAFPPSNYHNCIILCGPGNNGGDGLVAARHLKLFGYKDLKVYYPRPSSKPLFLNLEKQLQQFKIDVIKTDDEQFTQLKTQLHHSDLIVDALFGFSFHPPMRAPFDRIIEEMLKVQSEEGKKIIAVDIPSGWDVNEGPNNEQVADYQPEVLVSLTAPKPAALKLKKGSKHYWGGRFISNEIAERWGIEIPEYEGVDETVEIN
ncbi:DEKNAAC102892 [Brettanomyces naardenensis]|uniref:NAD(P)H-hydrate epimerase n=1 Tax=Brettanomyces naardenensis TaxID=13370 RepID=A0A448YM38_BRENA|nr:DEKNAAC102892 [Brettanomyces naardenensis]